MPISFLRVLSVLPLIPLFLIYLLIFHPVPLYASEHASIKTPVRIVSLSPAITELLFALGLGEHVVGVTSVCDRPSEALKRQRVGGMVNPSLESILALKPDIVVMIKEGNPKAVADRLRKLGIRIHVFSARRLAEIPPAIREMGNALGTRNQAGNLASKIESAIGEAAMFSKASKGQARKALFVISPSPLIVVGPGTIMDDAMALCGLENIAADAKTAYPEFSLETVIKRQPDIIFIGSAKGMKNEAEGLIKRLNMVKAVRSGHVFYAGDALYRPGPRITDGISELVKYSLKP
jgi:iron complex transport system substrate-binding protein